MDPEAAAEAAWNHLVENWPPNIGELEKEHFSFSVVPDKKRGCIFVKCMVIVARPPSTRLDWIYINPTLVKTEDHVTPKLGAQMARTLIKDALSDRTPDISFIGNAEDYMINTH